MAWKELEGYKYPYRVSDEGDVQRQLPSGRWKTLKPFKSKTGKAYRVDLIRPDGKKKAGIISALVADAFMGGTPPGMCRVHKNRMQGDNAVENITFMTHEQASLYGRPGNSRPVLKVDRDGNVVDIYRSTVEAAKKNHISQQSISKRCLGQLKDPYRLDGYNYIYETENPGRPRKNAKA